jgi:hypothetical protein
MPARIAGRILSTDTPGKESRVYRRPLGSRRYQPVEFSDAPYQPLGRAGARAAQPPFLIRQPRSPYDDLGASPTRPVTCPEPNLAPAVT